MNKDLDDRLIRSNEYKDALNIAVANSEDSDVGALENILQNTNVFPISSTDNIGYDTGKVIGYAVNSSTDSVYLFWTNYTDTSANKLGNHQSSQTGFNSAIIQYNAINSSFTKILVSGTFLNFSTTHPIIGINLLENLLFWTDNRNQPRKINIDLVGDGSYYNNEDKVSVAKYNPYEVIQMYYQDTEPQTPSGSSNPNFNQ